VTIAASGLLWCCINFFIIRKQKCLMTFTTYHSITIFHNTFLYLDFDGARPEPGICSLPGRLRWMLLPKERYGDSLGGRGSITQPSNWEVDNLSLSYQNTFRYEFKEFNWLFHEMFKKCCWGWDKKCSVVAKLFAVLEIGSDCKGSSFCDCSFNFMVFT